MGICQSIINECIYKKFQTEIPIGFRSNIREIIDNELVVIDIDDNIEEECLVCMSLVKKNQLKPTRCNKNECKLPCHYLCLQKWFDRYNKCPICNEKWSEIPPGYISR